MHRFYLAQKITGKTTSITDSEQVHHLKDVLRLKVGDKVTLFDSEGSEVGCRIMSLEKKQVNLEVNSRTEPETGKVTIAIGCAVPKGPKMDDIIDKLTQLGVDIIIPLLTERVIVKLEENKENRLERWRKIALSAAEQSQRNRLPSISPITTFKDLIQEAAKYDLKLIPNLEGARKSIRAVIPYPLPSSILVLIGPEGDFSPEEVLEAQQAGFIPVSFGNNILRVDTAAIAAAAYLRFSLV
jgi:16S rRNA (uracil1498-N3)-methyltransferase